MARHGPRMGMARYNAGGQPGLSRLMPCRGDEGRRVYARPITAHSGTDGSGQEKSRDGSFVSQGSSAEVVYVKRHEHMIDLAKTTKNEAFNVWGGKFGYGGRFDSTMGKDF